jgi:hypothetical protein
MIPARSLNVAIRDFRLLAASRRLGSPGIAQAANRNERRCVFQRILAPPPDYGAVLSVGGGCSAGVADVVSAVSDFRWRFASFFCFFARSRWRFANA